MSRKGAHEVSASLCTASHRSVEHSNHINLTKHVRQLAEQLAVVFEGMSTDVQGGLAALQLQARR